MKEILAAVEQAFNTAGTRWVSRIFSKMGGLFAGSAMSVPLDEKRRTSGDIWASNCSAAKTRDPESWGRIA
jgi:hypothetical protein